jgi:hypothetical protein
VVVVALLAWFERGENGVYGEFTHNHSDYPVAFFIGNPSESTVCKNGGDAFYFFRVHWFNSSG